MDRHNSPTDSAYPSGSVPSDHMVSHVHYGSQHRQVGGREHTSRFRTRPRSVSLSGAFSRLHLTKSPPHLSYYANDSAAVFADDEEDCDPSPETLPVCFNQDSATASTNTIPQFHNVENTRNNAVSEYENDVPHLSEKPSVRKFFRRASISLKGLVHRRNSTAAANPPTPSFTTPSPIMLAGKSRPMTNGFTRDTPSAQSPSPTQPSSTTFTAPWQKLRQAASLRLLSPHSPHHDHEYHDENVWATARRHQDHHRQRLTPAIGGIPPVIPLNTGSAARAAAANLYHEYKFGGFHDNSDNIVSRLPTELSAMVFAHLDSTSLRQAALVSREWHELAKSTHVWRDVYLREYGQGVTMEGRIALGSGQGIPKRRPDVDWRQVYQARHRLEHKWNTNDGDFVYLYGHLDGVYCVQFDEDKIITGSRDQTFRIWDARTFQCRQIFAPPHLEDSHLLYDEAGKPRHRYTGPDGTTMMNDPMVTKLSTSHTGSILCLQYDDELLVTGSSDGSCIMYDVKQGYAPIRRLSRHAGAVLDLAFDQTYVVTCSKDNRICVWDRATGAFLRQLVGHTKLVSSVQLRGKTVVSCSGDASVRLWDLETGLVLREFEGHAKNLACTQISADGRFIVSAGSEKVARVWDTETGACVHELTGHTNLIRSVHIDNVHGRVVTASYDYDVRVYDLLTGDELICIAQAHPSWVLCVKSDYRRIVSTSQSAGVLVVDFGGEVENVDVLES